MQRLLCLCVALMIAPIAVHAQAVSSGAVQIGTIDSIRSTGLNERRRFLVYTPPSYRDTTYLPRQYPVLYLLDGDAHFHSVTGLLHILGTGINGTFAVPEMIVVAIPNTDRTRDLTPTHVEKDGRGNPAPGMKTSGGMPAFFEFLRSELIPHIEKSYRTSPYRMLVGHSLGGITAINALYTMPEVFNAYVAIDPSLWYDDQLLLKQAKAHVDKPGLAGRTLFVGQANTINPDDTTSNMHFNSIVQFNSIMESYNRSGLRYGYRYYPSDDHGSVPLIAEYDALRFIFDGYKLDLGQSLERPAYVTEHYAAISTLMGYTVLPPEGMIDLLGRIQMSRDSVKALALFELNAEIYPMSPRAHDVVGEAWMARGDAAKAIAHYERALALNPRNEHAREMLRKLREPKR